MRNNTNTGQKESVFQNKENCMSFGPFWRIVIQFLDGTLPLYHLSMPNIEPEVLRQQARGMPSIPVSSLSFRC